MDHAGPVVEVVAYDPAWPGLFEAERRILTQALPHAVSVEHVGSTSVPGLAAKPIIDIVVVVPRIADVTADLTPVEQLGYEFRPDVFADDPGHEFFVKDTAGKRTHHLHVFDAASRLPQANRVFRDYLAAHPDAARRYAAAKRHAAAAHPGSRASYGNAKEPVMREVLAEAAAWGRRGKEPAGSTFLGMDSTRQQGAPWRCPVCREGLALVEGGRRWVCPTGHSFDVAREGYVNLLLAGRRRSRLPGDSTEMVNARRRFLATGAYDSLSAVLAEAAADEEPGTVLDVGCGEGHHTRAIGAATVLGVDVAKVAVAAAARAHPRGWYAVASAADLPLQDAAIDVVVNVFGPIAAAELARIVRPGGTVVTAHPGAAHLESLRSLVYDQARLHEVKPPLRNAGEWFTQTSSISVTFDVAVADAAGLRDLFTMTPYRWHAPPDIDARIEAAAGPGFKTVADVLVTTYRRVGVSRR